MAREIIQTNAGPDIILRKTIHERKLTVADDHSPVRISDAKTIWRTFDGLF
jgi:hypothetical protein